ncbi:hypothetical protein LJC74_10195 [Eubacteriales bacterium OttesenSCG-928-A19]|nr:hypothetical protein [Eubacteriales bacterium OttesenSCG-928-A19]
METANTNGEHFSFEANNEILRYAIHYRKLRGLSIKHLADCLNIPVRSLYNWNSRITKHLRPDYYEALYGFIVNEDRAANEYGIYMYKASMAAAKKDEQREEWLLVPVEEGVEPYEVSPCEIPEHLTQQEIADILEEGTRRGLRR